MDSQVGKQNMTEEEFRSCYPNVSIQQLGDKSSPKALPSAEKQQPIKTPVRTVAFTKGPQSANTTTQIKPAAGKVTQELLVSMPAVKTAVGSKTPNLTKTSGLVSPKVCAVTKTPITVKTSVTAKTPVPTSPMPIVRQTPVKSHVVRSSPSAVKTVSIPPVTRHQNLQKQQNPQNVTKQLVGTKQTSLIVKQQSPQNVVRQQLPQNVVRQQLPQNAAKQQLITQNFVRQQTPNVVRQQIAAVTKTPMKQVAPAAKEDAQEHSTMTVVAYVPPVTPQRKQITIEKIEQQQRIPVQLDANNQVVLQQVVNNNGQLVLQNRVAPVEATVQSVVIGTTAQAVAPVVTPLPQVEITTSEPLQALQVTQQVTLFRPKGNTFTVEDVKKQINLSNKKTSSAMTNVVSSTTNSVVAPVPAPAQPEQKKVILPPRASVAPQSPVRQSNRVNPLRLHQKTTLAQAPAQQYTSTRGQVRKISVKREIPMQKVSPMQPPPPPPQPLEELVNEEEVTTSEDMPPRQNTTPQLIVILPTGERHSVAITEDLPLDSTIQDLLSIINVPLKTEELPQTMSVQQVPASMEEEESEVDQDHWQEQPGSEPGEILGLQNEMEVGELEEEITEQIVQSGVEDTKDADTLKCEPIYREGLLAVCNACGITSVNFNRCDRCNRPIPPACKTVPSDSAYPFPQNSRKTKADSLTGEDSPKKRRCSKRIRRMEEPVCLTISDDEELLGLSKHHTLNEDSFHSDSNSQMSSCDKEPIITDDMSDDGHDPVTGGGKWEELLDNASASEKTYLQCRTVRIGSYKVVPKDKVLITPHGLKVTVPVLDSDQFVELKVMCHEIVRVLIHFGKNMPVLFFYTRPSTCARIRAALRMTNKNSVYYDSMSPDETHRRITLLPDKIDEDCKNTLKDIFGSLDKAFAELTGKEANDILVKTCPKVVQAVIDKVNTRSCQKQQQQQQQQQQLLFNGQNIQTIMVYPPPPEKGGIPINTEDYACLEIDQFLNDVIIDFYLKYVVEKTLSPEDRARTHVFSSFFYKRLTTKPPTKRKSMNPVENDPSASAAAKRHSRVKSWTKNVDLFTKDFIVIPINENSHWFLAIICFPGLTGPVRFSDNKPIELPGRRKTKTDEGKAQVGKGGKASMTIGSTTITAVSHTHDLPEDGEDRDEADGEDEELDVPDLPEDESTQKPTNPEIKEEFDEDQPIKKNLREPIKQPCILIFDSLAGASRSRVVATLRDYLRVEYEVKQGESRDFSGSVMKGTNLKCPQQTNYTDCGLYVLQYVEAFFQWPITDYHIPIKQCQDWFQVDVVNRKRYEIQQLLLRLMQEQGIDIEALNLPILNLRPEEKHLVEYSGTEEEEDEEDEEEQMCEEEEEEDLDYNDGIEDGELLHHDDDDYDQDHYMDEGMEHENHEMNEEDFLAEMEEDNGEETHGEKELEDVSLTPLGPVKGDTLKKYRIPRLITKNNISEVYKDD